MTFDRSRDPGQPGHAAHGVDPAQSFEDKETIQRIDVPGAAEFLERSRAARQHQQAPPPARLLIDWLLPVALGLLAALVLAVLTWLVVIV